MNFFSRRSPFEVDRFDFGAARNQKLNRLNSILFLLHATSLGIQPLGQKNYYRRPKKHNRHNSLISAARALKMPFLRSRNFLISCGNFGFLVEIFVKFANFFGKSPILVRWFPHRPFSMISPIFQPYYPLVG